MINVFKAAVFLLLMAAAFEDVKHKSIPMWMVLTGIAAAALCGGYMLFTKETAVYEILLSLIPGLAMLFVSAISGEQIGYGDGLMALAAGPVYGPGGAVLGLAIAFFAGGLFSVAILMTGRSKRGMSFPFVPFIAAGMGVSALAQI